MEKLDFPRFISSLLFYTLGRLPLHQKEQDKEQDVYESCVAFISRIVKITSSKIPLAIVLIALKYVHRLYHEAGHKPGHGSEAHCFLVALIVAQKSHADNCYTNKSWAAISKMSVEAINRMEQQFLACLGYDLFLREEEFESWMIYCQYLASEYSVTKHYTQKDGFVRRKRRSSEVTLCNSDEDQEYRAVKKRHSLPLTKRHTLYNNNCAIEITV